MTGSKQSGGEQRRPKEPEIPRDHAKVRREISPDRRIMHAMKQNFEKAEWDPNEMGSGNARLEGKQTQGPEHQATA